jgi:hypothetical protein
MAERAPSTSRRALLGAAAVLPIAALPIPVRAEPVEADPFSFDRPDAARDAPTRWTRRLARYRRLAERAKEVAETGFLRKANQRYERDRAIITARFGRWEDAIETPEGRTLSEAAFDCINEAEELYYARHTAPLLRAATVLAVAPAPDLPALLAKIRVMQAHQLQEDGALPRPALDLLAEDLERLGRLIRHDG